MSDSINFNFQNSDNGENISESLAAEINAAMNGNNSSATKPDAGESSTTETNDAAGPLASLLRTIGAQAHAEVKPDARLESAITAAEAAVTAPKKEERTDRRRRRRALISAPVRVRGVDVTNGGPDEISTTVDVSRIGLLFATPQNCYSRAMDVMVTFPYSNAPHAIQAEQAGRVMRVHQRPDGRYSVAIALGLGVGEDLVDSCGRKLTDDSARVAQPVAPALNSNKPLVLAVDADPALRASLKCYLQNEGYEVIVVGSSDEALDVLKMHTPALVIAEVEGEGFPGFNICGHVKSSPRLRQVPVVLMTRSAYPSDYANAHSIGAVVCMAKPFKQERLGHVVRLLAPLPKHMQAKLTVRPGDPSRRTSVACAKPNGNGNANGNGNGGNGNGRRFQFGRFGK
jgi:CheY-like chemotaxis protein